MPSILDWTVAAGDNATADAAINWQEGQQAKTVNNSARAMMGRIAEDVKDQGGLLATGGSPNVLTVASNRGIAAYANGIRFSFKATNSNTGPATLSLNAIGAKAIRKFTSEGETALAGGEIVAGGIYTAFYSDALDTAAGGWVLIGGTEVGAPSAVLSQAYAYNTNSSALTKNAWTTAPLGTEVDTGGIVGLATNKFTPVDDCEIEWSLTADYETGNTTDNMEGFLKTRLYNDTDGVADTYGSRDKAGGRNSGSAASFKGSLTSTGRAYLTGGKTYILQFWVSAPDGNFAFRLHSTNSNDAGNDITTVVYVKRR